ncbi:MULTISPECIES: N-acetylmuramoyl-L-alanine amidase [unclassified Zymobacter]|uniref:N-acetylmuramoyl-L-alanine amidase n=1 Tax=unclassified Zymobacter TaxID=3048685 RepID=UPI0039C3871D
MARESRSLRRLALPSVLLGMVMTAVVGCAGEPAKPTTRSPSLKVVDHQPISPPVLQDALPPRYYSPAEAQKLERRSGYRVDHSLRSTAANARVRTLVIHYTGGDDPAAIRELTGEHVGVHYLIPEQTGIYNSQPVIMQLADEDLRAWHAGVSSWKGRDNLNDTSIGIEIVNPGFTRTDTGMVWHPFSSSQINQVVVLAKDIVNRYGITPTDVVGHSDISPGRKLDPGPFFPWKELADAGVGAWPDSATIAAYRQRFDSLGLPAIGDLQNAFSRYGYSLVSSGVMDEKTRQVVAAFQMHFRPADYSGVADAETTAILFALLDKYQGPAVAQQLLGSRFAPKPVPVRPVKRK